MGLSENRGFSPKNGIIGNMMGYITNINQQTIWSCVSENGVYRQYDHSIGIKRDKTKNDLARESCIPDYLLFSDRPGWICKLPKENGSKRGFPQNKSDTFHLRQPRPSLPHLTGAAPPGTLHRWMVDIHTKPRKWWHQHSSRKVGLWNL